MNSPVRAATKEGEGKNDARDGPSTSSSLRLRRLPLFFARSLSIRGLASTSLVSMLFRLLRSFRGVSPGSRKARENRSLRDSRAMLGVAGVKRGGSKSESTSEGGAGGRSCGKGFGVLFGTRESTARRRAAGVSVVDTGCSGGIEFVGCILGVACASGSLSSSKFSESLSVMM